MGTLFRKSGTTRIITDIDPDPSDEDVSNLITIQDHLKLERLHQVSGSRTLSVVSIATDNKLAHRMNEIPELIFFKQLGQM